MFHKFSSRCTVLFLLVIAGFSFLSWRMIEIQYTNRKQYQQAAQNAGTTITYLPGSRGHILDCNDELIARSITLADLRINRYDLNDNTLCAKSLAWDELSTIPGWIDLSDSEKSKRMHKSMKRLIDNESEILNSKYLTHAVSHLAIALRVKREDLMTKIDSNPNDWFILERNMEESIYERVQKAIEAHKLFGFTLEKTARRRYASPELASHIVGYPKIIEVQHGKYTYKKEVGTYGVEKALESILAGKDGHRTSVTNPRGFLITPEPGKTLPPRPGLNVQLTLDMEIQSIIEEELLAGIKEYQAPRGCIIVMNPKTGAVLGLANYPSFNLNDLKNLDTNGINFATQMVYEPGSTIKVVAAAAAMNEGAITRHTPIFCHNKLYQQGNFSMRDHHSYDTLSAEWVLGKSSNIGVFKMAMMVGMQKHYDYLASFGFGKKTGIPLSGEVNGRFTRSENLYDFSSSTYGYAVSVTPMQMACAYSVIAGDGKLRKPQLLKAVIANDGTPIQETTPEVVREVIKPNTAREMRRSLLTVMQKEGTAVQANVPGYIACGKTGTVYKFNTDTKKYFTNRFTCSFAGMLPAADPEFVCIVVIDDPRSTGVSLYGGTIAGPVFSRACERIAHHLNITPTETVEPRVVNQ